MRWVGDRKRNWVYLGLNRERGQPAGRQAGRHADSRLLICISFDTLFVYMEVHFFFCSLLDGSTFMRGVFGVFFGALLGWV